MTDLTPTPEFAAVEPDDLTHPKRSRGDRRSTDKKFDWVSRTYPKIAHWAEPAATWLNAQPLGIDIRIRAIVAFLEKYLVQLDLPFEAEVLLRRSTPLPDFFKACCPQSAAGVKMNNGIHSFLNFLLLRDFSIPADDGRPVVSPAYHNPIPWLSSSGVAKHEESVHSPLPYGYIDELRLLLAQGPHFKDWTWAHTALGSQPGKPGTVGPEWFEVSEADIDKNDPDCVWRWRQRTRGKGGPTLEMWCPVRWVALLTKLILPLRTMQVRLLDSGEADTWRYEGKAWVLNPSRLAEGTERKPLQQGVFRRYLSATQEDTQDCILYINTNKTHDIALSGADRGYVLPWHEEGELKDNVFYWLEKLRNWQEKYNPVTRRTPWSELDGRHLPPKSEVQLAGYPDSCFLFRLPEEIGGNRHLPVPDTAVKISWYALLELFEETLAARGEVHANGSRIRFVPADGAGERKVALFPLHSLRVSLITSLALEGKVPFSILQKLVGHSRLIMTLYYTKPGAAYIRGELAQALKRMNDIKEATIQNFLLDTEHERLMEEAICNSSPSIAAAIPIHPAARNPAGWMPMHHGLCVVGGNTSEVSGSTNLGGCYNGGVNIGAPSAPRWTPVPGGARNCIRCRWFITQPHYLSALVGHFNTIAYHFDEARNEFMEKEAAFVSLQHKKFDTEQSGAAFNELPAYRQAERLRESAAKRFDDLAYDLVSCCRLIQRCQLAMQSGTSGHGQLIAVGGLQDIQIAFEETDSELLQLSGICRNAEVQPDEIPGKAVIRRSQLLDSVLYREHLPPVFMTMPEPQQLKVGNAFMARLAEQVNPDDVLSGERQLISLMDSGVQLGEYLGVDLHEFLQTVTINHGVPARLLNIQKE